jgi:DUF971 family protein
MDAAFFIHCASPSASVPGYPACSEREVVRQIYLVQFEQFLICQVILFEIIILFYDRHDLGNIYNKNYLRSNGHQGP